MVDFTSIKRVILQPHHLQPGRTKHTIIDSRGRRDFGRFVSLEIAVFSGDSGYYLLHISESGEIADTHHETILEAMHQAEFEFCVKREEWIDAQL